jgi:hypothetical protein
MLYFSILLHCIGLTSELLCHLCATSFTILSSYSFIGHYMFRPNWPYSDVQVVMVKNSTAHCNAVFFPPLVVASGYVGYHQFYLGALGFHVDAFGFVWFVGCGWLEGPCWGGSSVVCWSAIIVVQL